MAKHNSKENTTSYMHVSKTAKQVYMWHGDALGENFKMT
jgi:hypothetical protein